MDGLREGAEVLEFSSVVGNEAGGPVENIAKFFQLERKELTGIPFPTAQDLLQEPMVFSPAANFFKRIPFETDQELLDCRG